MIDGLSRLAFTDGDRIGLRVEGGTIDFLTGVNVGPTVPGYQPGELAISGATWRRWLPMMADAGFQAIRIYTPQPPRFYDELRRFNLANPDRPLYLVHGVWIPERRFHETHDLFDPVVVARFRRDLIDAVAVVHGDATLPPRTGYASGSYSSDVSPWLLSWAIGVEMDPVATRNSDRANAGRAPYDGRYFSATADATPTESWLAEGLDIIAIEEAARGVTVPLAFSNWPTTDPIEHPSEPLETEDMVGIDANHIEATGWPGGYYASYHAYPYYPDFQRHEPEIAQFELDGRVDPYAGYLDQLRRHHAEMPVVVLEYGLPSSLGSAHDGPLGRNQGGHTEQSAMAMNAELLRLQERVGIDGGFVFAWADEWFKFTWNTIDYELPPGRRQLWQNPLNNESNFGVIAVEDAAAPPIVVDGDVTDWSGARSQVIHEGRAGVREVAVARDTQYLYLRLGLDRPLDEDAPVVIGFDTVDGGVALPEVGGFAAADAAVVLRASEARAFVRRSNDPNTALYGRSDGGPWNEQRLITNRAQVVPTTGERFPVEWHELNPLHAGVSDPGHPDFDSRTLWARRGDVVELRLPYMMVGYADPSSLQALRVAADGTLSTETVERLGIAVGRRTDVTETRGYAWEPWNGVEWVDRPKVGFSELAETLEDLSRPS